MLMTTAEGFFTMAPESLAQTNGVAELVAMKGPGRTSAGHGGRGYRRPHAPRPRSGRHLSALRLLDRARSEADLVVEIERIMASARKGADKGV